MSKGFACAYEFMYKKWIIAKLESEIKQREEKIDRLNEELKASNKILEAQKMELEAITKQIEANNKIILEKQKIIEEFELEMQEEEFLRKQNKDFMARLVFKVVLSIVEGMSLKGLIITMRQQF